jgi:exodeoxyribonuclease-3
VRIVTWNCCRGAYAAKVPLIGDLAPDVAVVQECARPKEEAPGCVWTGKNPRQGLAVTAGEGWNVERLDPIPDLPRYALPVKVSGPTDFLLLGIWALADRPHCYVKAVIRAVELYRDAIAAQPTVIAGDFNSNAIWNRRRPQSRDHAYLVGMLTELGLVSSYHTYFGEAHGRETWPTFYLRWREHEPFHIDYCFAPAHWKVDMVSVGRFDAWARWSDHRPLVVDLSPPRASPESAGADGASAASLPRSSPLVQTSTFRAR